MSHDEPRSAYPAIRPKPQRIGNGDDQIKRDNIVQKRGPQEDQHAGQDGDDGLQGDIIHEGDPQVGARLIKWRRNRAEKTQPTFVFRKQAFELKV